MKVMQHEALRMFLAMTALILTAMLANPPEESQLMKRPNAATEKVAVAKKTERRLASQDLRSIRMASNRFRRF